jgi:hypothetical protein
VSEARREGDSSRRVVARKATEGSEQDRLGEFKSPTEHSARNDVTSRSAGNSDGGRSNDPIEPNTLSRDRRPAGCGPSRDPAPRVLTPRGSACNRLRSRCRRVRCGSSPRAQRTRRGRLRSPRGRVPWRRTNTGWLPRRFVHQTPSYDDVTTRALPRRSYPTGVV